MQKVKIKDMTGQALAPRWKAAAVYVMAVVLCLLTLVWALKLWQADLRVPFTYYSEANFNSLLIKTILDFGWHLSNPAMAMPSGLDLRDVPMADNNFLFLLIKLIGLFTKDYPLVINLFFLLTFPLTTLSALWVLRQFNISCFPALIASLLYTFLPFHFIRGQHHLFLSAYFLVPLAVMVILWVASGTVSLVDEMTGKFDVSPGRPKLILSIVICLLISASGTYFAYFACFFLVIAGILLALRSKNLRCLVLPGLLIGVIFGGLIINLLPNILYMRQHGETPIIRRHVIEAEIYSLRISQLILPVSGHRLFLMAKVKAAFNQRLFINENDDASLGAIGTIGFLTLLGWLLPKKPELKGIEEDGTGGVISHLSIFNIAAVLLGTFGGLSAIVALIITTKIRAYNRISIYIAFFSLFTLALLLDRFACRHLKSGNQRIAFKVCLAIALVLGLYDQTSPRFVPDYAKIKAEFLSDKNFMSKLQAALPSGAMVFQLPFVPFPEQPKVNKMFDYDHARGYLHTHGLRWNYGAMKGRDGEIWQKLVSSKPAKEMIETIALARFQGIYLNRNGYAETRPKIEVEIEDELSQPPLVSEDGKLVFFDLKDYHQKLREKYADAAWEAKREEALHPLLFVWSNGCSELEGTMENNFRWCASTGELQITNGANKPRQVKFEMGFTTENEANLWINGSLLNEHLNTGPAPRQFAKSVVIPPGKFSINFKSDARRVLAPGDFRHLVFRINNFKVLWELP
jgi:hypothetical protein